MPVLAPASEAGDVPVPEEDSDDECTNPSIYAGKVIKKLHDGWVDEDPSAFVPLLKSYKKEVIEFYLRPEELPNRGGLGYMDDPYVERLPRKVDNVVEAPEHSRVHNESPKEPEETLNGHMDYLRMFKNKDLRRTMKKVAVQKREHRHERLPPVCDKFSKEYILRVITVWQLRGWLMLPKATSWLRMRKQRLNWKQRIQASKTIGTMTPGASSWNTWTARCWIRE